MMALTNYLPILNHYVYSDLDLWPITLDQGDDTSFNRSRATIMWNIVQIYNEGQELWLGQTRKDARRTTP
jgi:hypothetical protein